jgi:hypothetical protein
MSSPDLSPVIFHASKGSFIHIINDNAQSGLPDVRIGDFKGWAQYASFSAVHEGNYVGNLFNLLVPNEYAYLVLDVDPAGYSGHYCFLGAKRNKDPNCIVYYGKQIEVIHAME